MKKFMNIFVPVVLGILIVGSMIWYGFAYDRDFTRDVLLQQARYHSTSGNSKLGAWFYNLAYHYSGQDENVAIELANQFKAVGNYTKAEAALSEAIADGGTVDLYIALCKTYVEQDKLLDAVNMLDSISNPSIKTQLDAVRPAAPTSEPDPGFYTEYISVSLVHDVGQLFYTLDREYPTTARPAYAEPFTLPLGETVVRAVTVADNGLVSPLSIMDFTVGGVIEPIEIADEAIRQSLMDLLSIRGDIIYSNQLWSVLEYTVPEGAESCADVSSLTYLESLTVHEMQLDSLSFLSGMDSIRKLDLTGCSFPAADLSIIASLPALQELTLSDCGLSTVAGLENAQMLTCLDLSRNTIRNIDPLSGLVNLKEINFRSNALTNLNALSGLNNLEKLDVSFNSISSVASCASCVMLNWLDISNNKLSNLSGIDYLANLEHFSADNNALTDITILGNCPGLVELSLAHNAIEDVSALSGLSALESLNIGYNTIEVLPAFPDGAALRTLNAEYNAIKDLTPLKVLYDLSYAYLDYNEITDVAPLESCYRLVMVNVYGNKVKGVEQLTAHDIIVNYDPT